MLRLYIIISLSLHFLPKEIKAQQSNYIFQHLTTKDGLASNFIQSIFQDSKGFYWVGTTSGLQKFDGYTFSKPLTAGKDLLPSPQITETSDGTLWISGEHFLYQYNRINEHFIPIVPDDEKAKMNLKVLEDISGNIWLVNAFHIYKYDAASKKLITWMTLPPIDPAMTFGAMAFNKDENIIWIQNGITLYKISPLKRKILKEENMPHQAATLWVDGNYLWLSFWTQHLCRYNLITGKKDWFLMPLRNKKSGPVSYAVAFCFVKEKAGRLWIGSIDGGLWYFDEPCTKIIQVKTDNQRVESFHYNEVVYSIMKDRSDNILVGSDKGINIFNPSQHFYTINNTDLPTKGSPSFISQKPFETSTGDILIPTQSGGWLQYDNNFRFKKSFTAVLNSHSSAIDKNKTTALCFAEDKKGRIWIGHPGGLLEIYEPQTGNVSYQVVPEFKKNSITNIQCDSTGNMWFALRSNNNNLIKWDVGLKKYKAYDDSLLDTKGSQVASMIVTKQGDIWVQTFGNGVYCFDPVREKIVEIHRNELPPYKIPSSVQGISSLNDSVIAVASFAEGFYLINTIQKKSRHLGTDEGLPSNIARSIATDSHNNYWIAMLSDLVRMDKAGKKIVSFDEDDGILNKSFSYGFTTLHDGRLIVVTNTGLLYFHPDSIKMEPPPADVLITGLKISNKPVLLDSILMAENNEVHLSYDQNFLTIEYVSISYLNRKKNQYFYKLEGLDEDWLEAGTQRIAQYTNLSPGKYVFMVRCQNRDEIFSKNITSLDIIVSPPLWRTWWAYTLYTIILCALTYFIYRNHIYSLKKKQQAEIKAIVATQEGERKRISRDLHDEVGTKLSALKLFVSSLHEKAVNINNEEISSLAKSSENFITEAMQDVRQLLLNLSPMVLEEFGYTTAVEGLVNKINETNIIKFTLVVFGLQTRLQKEYELVLYRMTQELINNVLKHAEAKNVSLQIGQRDSKIILMIDDDGKGFDVNTHRDGYGLQNLDSRTKLMHGIITIDSKPGKGTSVLIEIPFKEI